jgi:hypothetical protein
MGILRDRMTEEMRLRNLFPATQEAYVSAVSRDWIGPNLRPAADQGPTPNEKKTAARYAACGPFPG